jgi:FkbM family methyltransferase
MLTQRPRNRVLEKSENEKEINPINISAYPLRNFFERRWSILKDYRKGLTTWDRIKLFLYSLSRMPPGRVTDRISLYVWLQNYILKRIKVLHKNRTFNLLSRDNLEHLSDNYEVAVAHWLYQKGKTFVDVGANIGKYSVVLSDYYDRIYAFEPSEETFEVFAQNLKMNDITNIVAEKKALGVSFSEEDLYLNPNSGSTSLLFNPHFKTEKIQVVPLDIYGLKDISIIKIDVEGAEPQALRGMAKTIQRNQPTIFVEIKPQNYNKVTEFFKHHNYVMKDWDGHENYIFVPEDSHSNQA